MSRFLHSPSQGWGVLAVQYRQSTPVLVILVTVTDWRSTSRSPVLDQERQSPTGGKVPSTLVPTELFLTAL